MTAFGKSFVICCLFLSYFVVAADVYPLPGGDGPIQAKHYIQELVTTTLPCLFNYTVRFTDVEEMGLTN